MTKNIFKITISLFTLVLFGCSDAKTEKLIADTEFVETLMSDMTLKEKIGQMTQVDRQFLNDISDISKYGFGSLLSGGGSTPATNEPKAWADMYDSYQREALKTRLKIPLIYGIDAVHGHNNVVGATIFPHNIGLGATRDAALVESVARATALEVAATGMDWDFAPCLAVPDDYRWGRTYEGFSEDTDLVSQLGGAAVRGYQSTDISNPQSVLACAKHFIGDGGTTFGTWLNNLIDRGNLAISEEELRKRHLPPFQKAIDEGVATFMAAYNTWNDVKCHANKFLLTDLLKEELGFKGFVVSDWAAIEEIPGDYKSDIITSINAGIDLVMVPGSLYGQNHYKTFIKLLKESIEEGSIPMSRIDDAVNRILSVKYDLGLFNEPYGNIEYASHVGSEKHRELARKAVRKSMVLLKNESNILPLNKNEKLTVVGSGANNLGMQNGGWTVEWQGRFTPDLEIMDEDKNGKVEKSELLSFMKEIYDKKFDKGAAENWFKEMDKNSDGQVDQGEMLAFERAKPFQPEGTSILNAISSALNNKKMINYDPRADNLSKGQTVVAVIGEYPYAEGYGDNPTISLNPFDKAVLQKCYEAGSKVIVIMLSGRPLIISEHIDKWSGFLAAWLPGMAGEGIADVIFGDHEPTGKLSYSWPKDISQLPLNVGDPDYEPLFPFGYGLSY